MKNAKLLFAVFAAAAMFTSCSDDDNNSTSTSANIVGKWAYSKEGASYNGQEVLQDYVNDTDCATKDYVEFVDGGVYNDVDYYGTDCSHDTDASTWTKSGNTVTLGTGTDASTLTIVTLSATELKVKESYTTQGVTADFITVYTRE